MRLWLRLVLLIAVLTLVPLGLVGGLAIRAVHEASSVRDEEALSRQATTLATYVGGWSDAQARTLAGWQRVWALEGRDDAYKVGLVRATWRAMDAVVTAALVDDVGAAVVPAQFLDTQAALQGRIDGSPARVQALLEHLPTPPTGTEVALSAPYVPPGASTPVVAMVAGATGGEHLAVELDLGALSAVLLDHAQGVVALFDAQMQPVFGHERVVAMASSLSHVQELGSVVPFTEDQAGEHVQGVLARVPFTDWSVAVLSEDSGRVELARTIWQQAAGIAAAVLVLLALIAWGLDKTITSGVLELAGQARRIADGDYTRENTLDRSDELGELGRAINEMAERLATNRADLEAQHQEIEAFNTVLQARVDERTAALREAQAKLVSAARFEAVAELSAGLAHEINNPLASLLGQIQLLRLKRGQADPALEKLEQSALRCREVMGAMQALSTDPLRPQGSDTMDLRAMLREVVTTVQERAQQRGVTVASELSDRALWVRGAREEAFHALQTLLDVLATGTAEGGSLVLSERVQGFGITSSGWIAQPGSADAWRASGLRWWEARRQLEVMGLRVEPSTSEPNCWLLTLKTSEFS